MVDVNVEPFETEVRTRTGDLVRADVCLPADSEGPFPVVLGASPYQKALRHLPPFFAGAGDRVRREITNQDSLITDAP
ncbi:hypothetical protein ABZ646_21675 [Streptomyces sp. NPDC007162]|uniref:hypothetical protein n=1 Tax=Streptomyces sp. NPDC007162 TaxID=3156917 RepID=UPI0033F7C4FD